MAFPEADVARLLADCKRHCCVCLRWCGARIHLHHIIPRAENGPDEIDNAIPVCLDCHAEIESRSNMGRHFTQTELREHKRRWLEVCQDRPDILVHATRRAETGPIEALMSELEYNRVLVTGDDHRNDFATLAANQFDRAIAGNALASLEPHAFLACEWFRNSVSFGNNVALKTCGPTAHAPDGADEIGDARRQ